LERGYGDDQLRVKVLQGVEVIARELPKRHDWFEVMTVGLDGGGNLPILVQAPNFRAYPAGEFLGVSTVVPGWGFGWQTFFEDEEVYDILSWFLHYARQYIHRSNVARVLMIAWEEHSRILHPFGSRGGSMRYNSQRPMASVQAALDEAMNLGFPPSPDGQVCNFVDILPSNSVWLNRNMLDPHVHQAAYHCLRGHDLRSHEFDIEAVVAFDCAIQSVAQFLHSRGQLIKGSTRRHVCEALGLPNETCALAEYSYFLRNNFAAHAGGWRWWDAGEMVEDELMDEIAELAEQVLSKTADAEVQMRSVDPDPADWSEWFFRNFEMLWDAVWFERFDQWKSQQAGA
jgi:hypothetical protein